MKECVVVYNPQSGLNRPINKINNVTKLFKKFGYNVEIIYTKCRYDAINIVEKLRKVDLLLVAGGDGTFNEAVEGNLKRKEKLLMALLPFGTQNDVAHMYGLTNNFTSNLKMILEGEVKGIDICLLNDKPFTYVGCLGSFVDIAYATPRKLKKKYGRLAYILYGIKQLKQSFHNYDITYKVNDKVYTGNYSFIFITNSTTVAGNYIYEDAKLNDNRFEVLMCKVNNKWDIIKALFFLKRRNMNELPSFFKYYRTNNIKLKFKEVPASWCVDGDEFKHYTNEFRIVINREIRILVPQKNVKKLFE